MGDLDFEVIQRAGPYLWKGLQYTLQLTAVAAVGGIFWHIARLGTLIFRQITCQDRCGLRQPDACHTITSGDFLVLFSCPSVTPNDDRGRCTTTHRC